MITTLSSIVLPMGVIHKKGKLQEHHPNNDLVDKNMPKNIRYMFHADNTLQHSHSTIFLYHTKDNHNLAPISQVQAIVGWIKMSETRPQIEPT